MPILEDSYKAKGLFKNRHFNSLYPYLTRKTKGITFKRERITTPDDDFLDIDVIRNNNKKAVFLFHGLEGSTKSQYILGTAKLFSDKGWDVIAVNYRGCSGEPNKHLYSYHSGQTGDLDLIVNKYLNAYAEASIIGYSLGGNLVLKYTCDKIYKINEKVKSVMSVSAPIDLYGGAKEICSRKNKIYHWKFMESLMEKARIKIDNFPGQFDPDELKKIKTLIDFDHYFTGPVHGFTDAIDYYNQCNSLQFLSQVKIPTLLLSAQDDPFLPASCFPYQLAKENELLHLLTPKHGGHVGFYTPGSSHYWDELRLLEFANKNCLA